MFTAMACASVALVVLVERRRQLNGSAAGITKTSRDYSQIGFYVPFVLLIALGVVVDRIPW
jgi:hypothetical protein